MFLTQKTSQETPTKQSSSTVNNETDVSFSMITKPAKYMRALIQLKVYDRSC